MPSVGKLNLEDCLIILDSNSRHPPKKRRPTPTPHHPPPLPPNQIDASERRLQRAPNSLLTALFTLLFNRMFVKPFSLLQSVCAIRNTKGELRSNQRRHSYRFSPSACLTFIMTFLLWLYGDYATRSMPRGLPSPTPYAPLTLIALRV